MDSWYIDNHAGIPDFLQATLAKLRRALRRQGAIIRAEEYGAGVVLHCAWSTKDREVFPVGLYPQGENTLLYASPVMIPGIRNNILMEA